MKTGNTSAMLSTRQLVKEAAKGSSAEATTIIEGRHGRHVRIKAGRKRGSTHLFYFKSRVEAERHASQLMLLGLAGMRVSVDRVGYQYLVCVEDSANTFSLEVGE